MYVFEVQYVLTKTESKLPIFFDPDQLIKLYDRCQQLSRIGSTVNILGLLLLLFFYALMSMKTFDELTEGQGVFNDINGHFRGISE